jgi:hypothetical protein
MENERSNMSDYVSESLKALEEKYDKSTVVGVVTTTLPITAHMVDAVLVGAFDGSYGASFYWADALNIKVTKPESGDILDELWYEVTLRENEDVAETESPIYTVNAENLTKAFQTFVQEEPPANTSITGYIQRALRENDPGYLDADCADVLVQIAVFGRLIYG